MNPAAHANTGTVQMSGAGAGQHPASVEPAPSTNTPAKATLGGRSHALPHPAASNEHTSPMARPGAGSITGARKRRANEHEGNTNGADTAEENATVIHHTHSRMAHQPSGRGEVGGSMIHLGGHAEVAMPSRLGCGSVAAWSQLAVHMPPPHAAPTDSGSNQQEEDTAKGRGARGRAKVRQWLTRSSLPILPCGIHTRCAWVAWRM